MGHGRRADDLGGTGDRPGWGAASHVRRHRYYSYDDVTLPLRVGRRATTLWP